MNLPPRPQPSRTDRSIGGVLSAVGSLLQALGGERGESEPPEPVALEAPMPMMLPSSAIPPTRPRSADPTDEASALLADARTRAQAIMDESMARAEELLRTPPESPEQQTLERIRRTVSDIATDVRGLHSRLDEIEALVRSQSGYRAMAPAAPAPSPLFGSPRAVPPTSEPAAFAPALRSTFAPPESPEPAPPAPALDAPAPDTPVPPIPPTATPPPLLPTSWAGLSASTPPVPAPEPASAELSAPAPAPSEPVATTGTFDPVSGPISLHVSPVAGFQGLMRVQDALVRIRGVREAGVEAYAQGEARLRLRLSTEMDAASLASALTELLGRATRVAASSTSERTLRLVLE